MMLVVVVLASFALTLAVTVAVLLALLATRLAAPVVAKVVVATPAVVAVARVTEDLTPSIAAVVDESAADAVSVNINAGAVEEPFAGLTNSVAVLKVLAGASFAAVEAPGVGLEPVPIHTHPMANTKAAATPASQPLLLRGARAVAVVVAGAGTLIGLWDAAATGVAVAFRGGFSIGLPTPTTREAFAPSQASVNGGTLMMGTTSTLDGMVALACATDGEALATALCTGASSADNGNTDG